MFWLLIDIIDIILFIPCAFAVVYILVFSIISCFYQRVEPGITRRDGRFLIITTVTANDQYIEETIKSILKQQYEQKNFELVVVGDKLTPLQKIKLAQYPITLLCADLKNGTKGRAQRYAIENLHSMKIFDNVILLDPDETVMPDFLTEVNKVLQTGQRFFQLHRKPQNTKTETAIISATMEEINNSIFRKGHVVLGMPSSLIGSAVSLDFSWFKNNISKIETNDEEKSLEALLLSQNIFVDYIDDVCVYVRPLSSISEVVNQRKRWMQSRISTLYKNIKKVLPSFIHWNKNIIDRIISWTLIPRIILVGIIIIMGIILPLIYFTLAIKWWILFLIVTFAFALATPDYLAQDKGWAHSFKHMPFIIMGGLFNLISNNTLSQRIRGVFSKKKPKSINS